MILGNVLALSALALAVSAASYKRVACPDGKHAASDPACCVFFELADESQEKKFDNECAEDG